MGTRNDSLRARLMATFRPEADEHLRAISGHLVLLERERPAPEAAHDIEAAFRIIHTLKGAARSVGLEEVERLCQGVESVLSRVKGGRLALTRDHVGHIQDAMDAVARLIAGQLPVVAPRDLLRLLDLGTGPVLDAPPPVLKTVPAPSAATPASIAASPATVRIDVAQLDHLQSRTEELVTLKLAADERVREAQEIVETLRHVPGPAAAQARRLLSHLSRDRRAVATAVTAIEDEVRPLRMTAAASVLELLPPMAAQMARTQSKEIDFETIGGDLTMDRKVLEAVKDPLLHLVRNALDHGIERPAVREHAGKPRRGRIVIGLRSLEGRRVEVRVQDDGAGVDVAALRAAAVRGRVLSAEETEALSETAALDLVFSSGVSTSPVITDLSGHGLGLAIVRDRIEQLGGGVSLETAKGKGTTVRLVVPARVATFRGLLVSAGSQPFLLPIEAVDRALRVAPGTVRDVGGREAIQWNGRVFPARALDRVLGLPRRRDPGDLAPTALLLSAGDDTVALLVDEVLGEREVLVKELRPPLTRVRHVAGAGLLGSGALALILRPADIVRSVREAPAITDAVAASPHAPSPLILVVDDSITTRTMEKNLLEAAGFRVRTASDGLEAWTALKSEPFDMVVSDVDMPRLNGFELTARLRADAAFQSLPVVLVTALESREDKERGIEVGANAYVIKSGFDQSKLLEIIQRLL